MAKRQKNFRLNEKTLEEIKEYSLKNKMTEAAAIEMAWETFLERGGTENAILINDMLEAFDEKYRNLFTGLRLSSRQAEFYSSVIIEILNTFAVKSNYDKYISTLSFNSPVVSGAVGNIKERMANYKQKSDFKRNGK